MYIIKQLLLYVSLQESDLHTALWLEQSAHAFLKHQPVPMIRKYALHLVLAANHFSKAGQVGYIILWLNHYPYLHVHVYMYLYIYIVHVHINNINHVVYGKYMCSCTHTVCVRKKAT